MPVSSTLHQFLLLPENRSAYRALQNAEKHLRQRNSKLIFIYGPTGAGKSHLISQALREYRRSNPKLVFESITASEFAAQLADASSEDRIREFQQHYRRQDLFVCEDLQSLQKRKQAQLQFVACLDALSERGSLVVLSSTSLPGGWRGVDRRLIDRCRGGLTAKVSLPSKNSRIKLLDHFAQLSHEPIPESVSTLIAERLETTPRDLKSVMDRLVDACHQRRHKLTVDFVKTFLDQEVLPAEPALREIIRISARHFGLKVRELKSKSRRADVVRARQCAMYLARELTSLTQSQIAHALGKADHTAVIRATQKISELLETDPGTRHELAELKQALERG